MTHRPMDAFRHVLYLQRRDVLDVHREVVAAFFAEQFPSATLAFSDGSGEPVPSNIDCLIAPAAGWVGPILAGLPSLRWVHFTGSGTEGVQALLRERPSLAASKSPGVSAPAMAEFAIGAILHFAKEFDRFADQQREHRWERTWLAELGGRRLLVLGAGAVAEALAIRAKAFGLHVSAVARRPGPRASIPDVLPIDRLGEALPLADYVICALPLTDATRGLIGTPQLRSMSPRSVLVNIARGGIVDEPSLVHALKEGWIRGAALDVFEEEPLPSDSALWDCPSILIFPHVSGTTDRYLERLLQSFKANWEAFVLTGRPATPVDSRAGY